MHRVGIIPFDIEDDALALLFVTSRSRGRWVLPKGKVHPGESHQEACQREGFEEAGVRGLLLDDFPITAVIGKQTSRGLIRVPVTFYPLFVLEQHDVWPEQSKRQRHWALIEDAAKVAYRDDYLVVVRQFQELQPWIIEAVEGHRAEQQAPLSLAQ